LRISASVGRGLLFSSAVAVPEGFLERRQLAVGSQALDRRQLAAVSLDGEHRARLHGAVVHENGARAALAGVTPDVRARQAKLLAEKVDQQIPRFDGAGVGSAVDSHTDRHAVSHKPSLAMAERTVRCRPGDGSYDGIPK
jgi:hypothetical protein